MIGEFAFTPSVFDETAHPDAALWSEQLRELGNAMFPKTAAWPVMVADLYDGSWMHTATSAAKAVTGGSTRILCEKLLSNISKTLVYRPIAGVNWPADDLAWGREALASHAIEAIDRIVSCREVQDILAHEGHPVRCIDEVHADGCWSDINSQWPQELRLASQIQAVRKLTLHAEFICLITPHVRAESGDETDFVLKLIQAAFRRPDGYRSVEIEVHVEGPEQPANSDFALRLGNAVSNKQAAIRSVLRNDESVRLVLWPKFVDRYLIAGVYTETSNGTRMRSPRWGIAMQHIARKSDDREAKPPTSWSVLPNSQLGDVFARYCSRTSLTPLHSSNGTR